MEQGLGNRRQPEPNGNAAPPFEYLPTKGGNTTIHLAENRPLVVISVAETKRGAIRDTIGWGSGPFDPQLLITA
jgi:hypothetical protein